MTDPQFF